MSLAELLVVIRDYLIVPMLLAEKEVLKHKNRKITFVIMNVNWVKKLIIMYDFPR